MKLNLLGQYIDVVKKICLQENKTAFPEVYFRGDDDGENQEESRFLLNTTNKMETVKLYHFTTKEHSIGEIVPNTLGEYSFSYSKSNEINKQTIDCFDDYISQEHQNYVLRKHAVYAFDNASYAKRFGDSLCRQLKINIKSGHVYEIEMEVSYKGPFVLVNRLQKSLGDSNQEKKVLEEYFCPKEKWKVYEYIGKCFVRV